MSVHPGVSATGLVSGLGFWQRALVYVTTIGKMRSPKECAWSQQWAATAALGCGNAEVESAYYYEPVSVKTIPSRMGGDDELAERLWVWTERELEPYMSL